MENLQIVSLNLRSLQNKNKRNRVFQYFKMKKFNVMLLRETYSTLQDESEWKKEWEGPGIEALPLFLLSATTNVEWQYFVQTTKTK